MNVFLWLFLLRDKSSTLFLLENEHLHIHTSSISLPYKTKINLAVLFRHKTPENQYMRHKKYGVHLLHTRSKKAHFAL